MIAAGERAFMERANGDGTLDLLCLSCRALVGENLSHPNLPVVEQAHRCRSRLLPFGFKRISFWPSAANSGLEVNKS
jgi:hypothetical protein